jgi:two-component system, cell cycle response regulator DivK
LISSGRVLVVEDDVDNQELVCFLLHQAGYEVLTAKDGRHGLELAAIEQPDILLLDMSIPEVDGWRVANLLKADERTRSICIVALTGHTAPGDRKRALDAGCDAYITKPLDVPNFANEVRVCYQKYRGEEG